MGLFDNLAQKLLPTAIGNSLSSVSTKVQESSNRVAAMFGGAGPFSKVAAVRETINEGTAKYQLLASDIARSGGNGLLTLQQKALTDPFSTNAIVMKTAQQVEQSQREAAATSAQINSQTEKIKDDHRVQLTEMGSTKGEAVVFVNMPDITESRTIEYEAVSPAQAPAAFQKYKGTSSVQWTVNATLTSRTTDEATANLLILNRLRGWSMPYFGSRAQATYGDKLGAPPPVLEFKGWRKQMVGPVPVVITSLNWTFPQDVDYIPANEQGATEGANQIPFPTVLKVSLSLVETFSTAQMNGFDLDQFKLGNFSNAWKPLRRNNDQLNFQTGNQAPSAQPQLQISPGALSSPADLKVVPTTNSASKNTTVNDLSSVGQTGNPMGDFGGNGQ